jgi:hypothetical protein
MLPHRRGERTLALRPLRPSDPRMAPVVEDRILRVVPHRPPILRVHAVQAASADAVEVRGQEPAGPGELPWSCGAIEGIAQAAAVLLAQGGPPPGDEPPRGMLVAVKRFTVAADPAPGTDIVYRVRLVRRLGPTAMVAGRAEQDGRTLAEGELTLWSNVGAAPR